MKRGTPRHPKVVQLCELLNIRLPLAVGFLELLWHFTAEFAPQGNIGKYSDQAIEAALGWGGSGSGRRWEKPGALIEAFCACGFVDIVPASDRDREPIVVVSEVHREGLVCVSSPYHRLIVHDWWAHADESVRRKLERAGEYFLTVTRKVSGIDADKSAPLSASRARDIHKPEPEPMPPPEPGRHTQEECVTPAPTNGVSVADRFGSWFGMYRGRKAHPDAAAQAWISRVTAETVDAAFACMLRYNQSAEVARGVCMEAGKFIHTQADANWMGTWPKARPRPETANERRRRNVIAGMEEMSGKGPANA